MDVLSGIHLDLGAVNVVNRGSLSSVSGSSIRLLSGGDSADEEGLLRLHDNLKLLNNLPSFFKKIKY